MLISQLFENPIAFVIWILAILIALSVHEYAHAFAADQLGDDTSKHLGRLTLNPLSHVDGLGLLMLIFVGFGWGKPVPVNTANLRNRKWGEAIVAFAGPLSNLILILIFGTVLWYLYHIVGLPGNNLLIVFLDLLVIINAVLMLFNLLPIPPLDGSKVLFAFLPPHLQHIRMNLEQKGPMILFFVLIADSLLHLGIFSFLLSGIVFGIRGVFL